MVVGKMIVKVKVKVRELSPKSRLHTSSQAGMISGNGVICMASFSSGESQDMYWQVVFIEPRSMKSASWNSWSYEYNSMNDVGEQ